MGEWPNFKEAFKEASLGTILLHVWGKGVSEIGVRGPGDAAGLSDLSPFNIPSKYYESCDMAQESGVYEEI